MPRSLTHADRPSADVEAFVRDPNAPRLERLQKLLAAAGVGSRRECEEIILSGRVEVDGKTVTELGSRADSRRQKITVDGEPVKFQRRVYYAVNKPTGVLSTNSDPAGRIRVVDLIGQNHRLFTVGRLDQHSEGLIIVTNDGELTERLTHPRYGVPKIYHVQVAGEATPELAAQMVRGVHLEEGVAKAKRVTIRRSHKTASDLEMVLTEGRNREIRRMLAKAGHKVQRLTRIGVGPIRLGRLKPGQYRPLDRDEVKQLKEAAYDATASTSADEPMGMAEFASRHAPKDSPPPRTERSRTNSQSSSSRPQRTKFRPKSTGGGRDRGRTYSGRAESGRTDSLGQGASSEALPPRDRRGKLGAAKASGGAAIGGKGKRHPLPFLKTRSFSGDGAEREQDAGATPESAGRGERRPRPQFGKPGGKRVRPDARGKVRGSRPATDRPAPATPGGAPLRRKKPKPLRKLRRDRPK